MMQRMTPVVLNLIIINVLVFLSQSLLSNFNITELGSLHYFRSEFFRPFQYVTYMFLHDPKGINHLLFNMLSLWIFGTTVETYLGPKRFLMLYMACGLAAGILTQLTIPFSSNVFAHSAEGLGIVARTENTTSQGLADYLTMSYSMLGASGAIMGVMAAFAYLFPDREMMMMFIPIPIKAKYLAIGYILVDLFGGFHRVPGDTVAHFAHIGGAIAGFLLVYFWNKTNRKTFY